jgi:arginase
MLLIEGITSLVGLPFYTQSKYNGMALASSTLRKLGIADVIRKHSRDFRDRGDVKLSTITEDSGPQNLRNFPHFIEDTNTVFHTLSSWPEPDDFVLCLGGECALITGEMAAFKKSFTGRVGILWMDAHGDFNTPATSPSGFIGGMCLALTCGRGPSLTDEVEKLRPLVSEENIIHVGSRALDSDEARAMEESALELYPASKVHRNGTIRTAQTVAHDLAEQCDWIVCHLDLDVIDPRIIPAVNFPASGEALSMEDVITMIRNLRETGKLRVFNIAAYNPLKDNYNYECGMKVLKLVSNIIS